MRKVVFINHDPLTSSIKRNFFLEEFQADGIEVEYWCVRELTNYSKQNRLINELTAEYYTEVVSISQLKKLIEKEQADTFFCVELWFIWNTLPIYKLLKAREAFLFSIDWYTNTPRASAKMKLATYLASFNFIKLLGAGYRKIGHLSFKITTKRNGISRPSLLFSPGMKSKELFEWAEVVPLYHHDFELYKESLKTEVPTAATGKYAVFLDSMLVGHPDLLRIKKVTMEGSVYFRKMNDLFNYIEAEKGLKVIIAAHPKANYTNEFQGRQVIKGQTNQLVKDSSLVIVHQSTSIFYAVLNNKPILLTYTDEFEQKQGDKSFLSDIYYSIQLYKGLLGCSWANADKLSEVKWEPVDNGKYQEFIRNYITTDDPDGNYQIIKKALLKRKA